MGEHRASPRIPVETEVLLIRAGSPELCLRTRDLSQHGVFLCHPDPASLVPGDQVTLQVRDLPDAPQVPARVVRVMPDGVALAFLLDDA